mmetsp:Transcript_23351/g.58607  ORF Transcript_23351/g.58607 Transcript_23351/m.58607 type:complete len:274 (+) Transcript_23351:291-1112(+)
MGKWLASIVWMVASLSIPGVLPTPAGCTSHSRICAISAGVASRPLVGCSGCSGVREGTQSPVLSSSYCMVVRLARMVSSSGCIMRPCTYSEYSSPLYDSSSAPVRSSSVALSWCAVPGTANCCRHSPFRRSMMRLFCTIASTAVRALVSNDLRCAWASSPSGTARPEVCVSRWCSVMGVFVSSSMPSGRMSFTSACRFSPCSCHSCMMPSVQSTLEQLPQLKRLLLTSSTLPSSTHSYPRPRVKTIGGRCPLALPARTTTHAAPTAPLDLSSG